MRTSNLPKTFVVLFLFFIADSSIISGCSSRRSATHFHREDLDPPAAFVININTADANELQKLPQVGPALAERIIEHRSRYGPFRKPEHVLIVDGVSEKRFQAFRQFVSTE